DYVYGSLEYSLTDEEKATTPTVSDYLGWHSLKQIAWLKYLASTSPSPTGEYALGTDPDVLHAVLSSDESKVYILEHIQKNDAGFMSLEDQTLISGTETWLTT